MLNVKGLIAPATRLILQFCPVIQGVKTRSAAETRIFYNLIHDCGWKPALQKVWYFLIKQADLDSAQYQALQKQVSLTEVETFNEPYENWYIFTVEKEDYTSFMDDLDRRGISYELTANRPTRAELLDIMR